MRANIDFKNYAKAFDSLTTEGGATLFDMFLNSMWYSFGTTTIGLFFATCCAYVCAKYKFPGRRFIYVFALVMMMVPIIGSQSSALAWNKLLHGYDTPLYALINAQTIDGEIEGIYTLGGIKVEHPVKGVNIIKYTDGRTRKINVK